MVSRFAAGSQGVYLWEQRHRGSRREVVLHIAN
jgi:thiamine phosphate synthase YjbQ (UPF0047 family)